MGRGENLYWTGNAAKSRIIGQILDRVGPTGRALVFDFGCGRAAYWPQVLDDFPGLSLAFYDPDRRSMEEARQNLAGLPARALTDPDREPSLGADYVVSLSVLEHVFNRPAYLAAAWKHLKPGGLLFLNYDDGHFRNRLDLSHPWESRDHLKEFLLNLAARPLAALGLRGRFQRRVTRGEVEELARRAGFGLESEFYSNLPSLKGFHSELEGPGWDEEARQEFARAWQDLEELLNRRFLRQGSRPRLGDPANLWVHMPSRTLVLKRPHE